MIAVNNLRCSGIGGNSLRLACAAAAARCWPAPDGMACHCAGGTGRAVDADSLRFLSTPPADMDT